MQIIVKAESVGHSVFSVKSKAVPHINGNFTNKRSVSRGKMDFSLTPSLKLNIKKKKFELYLVKKS